MVEVCLLDSHSAIVRYLLDNPTSAREYNPQMFSILESSDNELRVSFLEEFHLNEYSPALSK